MSGTEPIWIPIVIAAVNGVALIASEYLGSRDSSNPNLCRSLIGASFSAYNYIKNKVSPTPSAPEQIEMQPTQTIPTPSRPDWIKI
jgi:hypothetical protein